MPNDFPKTNRDVDEILRKHGAKIESQIRTEDIGEVNFSRDYLIFKEEMAPEISRYERWCKSLGSLVKLKISEKDRAKVQKFLDVAHLDIEPWQALTLSFMAFFFVFILGALISLGAVLINGSLANFPILLLFLLIIVGLFLFYYFNHYPERLANKWRLKASSQMVPAILYMVVYMRHTPNMEKAVAFASHHVQYPLALDLKKVFYDVSVGKFPTMKESLDSYLEVWRDYSPEFIESFHLIESSLFEPDDTRRIATLEKSLQIILDGVYDKMIKFTHDVRSPLTNVYMLGIVLPTLALALLPLASALIGDLIKWYHVFILFTLIIPFLVFYLVNNVLILRPGGYGESELLERNPLYPKYKSNKPYVKAALICLPLIIIGLIPLIFLHTPVPALLGLQKDYAFSDLGFSFFPNEKIFGFIEGTNGGLVGPFGIISLMLSMFIPLGIALFFIIAYRSKTREMIKERESTRELENEFNNSLFQLGNRIGNGLPPELAFGRVAESARGLKTEDFFRRVNYNITQMGMGVEEAIFDSQRGVINYYPSELIATSMRILVESSKKGLSIAAVSLMSISEYVKNIQKTTERLRDMLAEVISDMKSNMVFLAPLLSGIVIGLAMMIADILGKLSIPEFSTAGLGFAGLADILNIFPQSRMIPPYYLQIAIGIYLIEIVFILTGALVTIDSGEDKLQRTSNIWKNLSKGISLYIIAALIASLSLFFLSSIVLGSLS
jgi:hypothetical protein